jgi:hypothetical protein
MGTFCFDALSDSEWKVRQEYRAFKDKKKKIGKEWGREMIRNENKASGLQVFLFSKTDKYIKRTGRL